MKLFSLIAALSVICGVKASADSTVVCESCPPASSTSDIVTRSDEPVVHCTAAPLSMITSAISGDSNESDGSPSPTDVPAVGNKIVGGVGGVAALVVVAVNLL